MGSWTDDADDFDLIEPADVPLEAGIVSAVVNAVDTLAAIKTPRVLGTTEITQANIKNNHIYLRLFFDKFSGDAIGGSNVASAARREIAVDWGGETVVMTDLDSSNRFFRKRGWVRSFFQRSEITAGDIGIFEEVGSYVYRVRRQVR